MYPLWSPLSLNSFVLVTCLIMHLYTSTDECMSPFFPYVFLPNLYMLSLLLFWGGCRFPLQWNAQSSWIVTTDKWKSYEHIYHQPATLPVVHHVLVQCMWNATTCELMCNGILPSWPLCQPFRGQLSCCKCLLLTFIWNLTWKTMALIICSNGLLGVQSVWLWHLTLTIETTIQFTSHLPTVSQHGQHIFFSVSAIFPHP